MSSNTQLKNFHFSTYFDRLFTGDHSRFLNVFSEEKCSLGSFYLYTICHLADNILRGSVWFGQLQVRSRLTVGWIGTKICTDTFVPQRMNPNDFGDPLTFPLVSPQGSYLWFWVKYLNNGFPWNLVQTLMSISGFCNNCGDTWFFL